MVYNKSSSSTNGHNTYNYTRNTAYHYQSVITENKTSSLYEALAYLLANWIENQVFLFCGSSFLAIKTIILYFHLFISYLWRTDNDDYSILIFKAEYLEEDTHMK